MFGVFMRSTEAGIFILVNEKPYTTEVKFLTSGRFEALPEMIPGCKIEYDESSIQLSEYFDCIRCHMPLIEGEVIIKK